MSEENFPKNQSYSLQFDNGSGAFQMACIDTPEEQHLGKDEKRDKRYGIKSGNHSHRNEAQEKSTSDEESTSEDQEGDEQPESTVGNRASRKDERRKGNKLVTEQKDFTIDDQEGDEQPESTVGNRASRKEERRKGNKLVTEQKDSTSDDEEGCAQYDGRDSRKGGGKPKEKQHEQVRKRGPAEESKRKDKHRNKSKVASKKRDEDIGSIVPHQLAEDFAFAENQGSVKHILILGTIGSGKYTIARNISTNPRNFPSRRSLRERSGIIQCIDDGNLFKFVLVDTGGARMPDVYGAKGPSIGSIAANIKGYFKSGISLIMVVVRYDCNTPDDFEVLANLINGLFTDGGKKHIALIHNGCEMLSEDNVIQYTEHFNASGPSRQLSSLCRKDTVATGFPSSEESRSEMAGVFKQITEQSKMKLSSLVESCRFLQPYSKILKANNDPSRVFPETKADCCLM